MDQERYIVSAAVCIMTHVVRSVYEILKHRKRLTPGKLSFVIIFINMGLLWTSWFALCSYDPQRAEMGDIVRYGGIVLVGLGIAAFAAGLWTIKTLESHEGDLITVGIYAYVRHPMYLGFILWLLGGPALFGALTSLVLSIPFIANVLFWRHLEEIELERRFPSYGDYRKRTTF